MDWDSIFDLEIDTSSQASLNAADYGMFEYSLDEKSGDGQRRRGLHRADSKSAPLHDLQETMSTSIPIAIPSQLMRVDSPAGSLGSPSEIFVPPHLAAKHVAESLPVTTSAQLRTRNRVFMSTGFLPSGLEQGFLVSRTSTQPQIPEHSDERMTFNARGISPPASRSYTRRMSLPAQPSAQKHVPTAHHPQRTCRLHLR